MICCCVVVYSAFSGCILIDILISAIIMNGISKSSEIGSFSMPGSKGKTVSFLDYDRQRLIRTIMTDLVLGIAFGLIHSKFGALSPLVFVALLILFGSIDSQLFKLYIRHQSTSDNPSLARPWDSDSIPSMIVKTVRCIWMFSSI